MSQTLSPGVDIDDGGFLPTPIVTNVDTGVGKTKQYSDVPVGSVGAVSFRMAGPINVPTDNTNVLIGLDYGGSLIPVAPDVYTGVQCSLTVTHDSFGVIAELGGFDFTVGNTGSIGTTPILLNDLLAVYSTDAETFFGLAGQPTGPLVIDISVGVGIDSTPNPSPNGTDVVGFDIGLFLFTIPDGSGADIEVVGDGGIELNSEADTAGNMITGSGGLEIAGGATFVLSADASGIYTLIPGQHFDTIYTRNVNDDDTADIAMPPPFGKTGYFSG